MPVKTLMLILSAVGFSVMGQLLLKSGTQQIAGIGRVEFLLTAVRTFPIVAGIGAWGCSTICWLFVLRVTPLSQAYMLNSLTYVLTPLLSVYLFGEPISRSHVVGMALIIMGVAFVLYGK